MTFITLGSTVVAAITIGTFTALGVFVTPQHQDPKKANETPSYSGTVGEWWVAAPGIVQFQLVGSGRNVKDGKNPDLWFETPADKDLNTLFENLVLDVVAHAATQKSVLTVEAKNSSGDDGSSAAKAFDVVRVGFGKN